MEEFTKVVQPGDAEYNEDLAEDQLAEEGSEHLIADEPQE